MVQGSDKQALMDRTSLVVGMAICLVKGERDARRDVHPVLLQAIFQKAPVFDPCFLRGLLLHHWNLAMPCMLRRHSQNLGKAGQAIVEVARIARPHARIQAAQHKPAEVQQCLMQVTEDGKNNSLNFDSQCFPGYVK